MPGDRYGPRECFGCMCRAPASLDSFEIEAENDGRREAREGPRGWKEVTGSGAPRRDGIYQPPGASWIRKEHTRQSENARPFVEAERDSRRGSAGEPFVSIAKEGARSSWDVRLKVSINNNYIVLCCAPGHTARSPKRPPKGWSCLVFNCPRYEKPHVCYT